MLDFPSPSLLMMNFISLLDIYIFPPKVCLQSSNKFKDVEDILKTGLRNLSDVLLRERVTVPSPSNKPAK